MTIRGLSILICTTLFVMGLEAGAQPRWTRWHWGKNAHQEAVIRWEDDEQGPAYVEIRLRDGSTEKIPAAVMKCHDQDDGDEIGCTYIATVNELLPSTQYSFRVSSRGMFSKWHQLKTSPAPGDCRSLRIVALGDNRGRFSVPIKSPWIISPHWKSILAAANAENPGAILNAGDIVGHGGKAAYWRAWLEVSSHLARSAFLPAVGNHDVPADTPRKGYYHHLVSPPSDSPALTWVIQAGRVLIAAINSETTPVTSQLDWLKSVMRPDDTSVDWRIVMAHRPIFSSGFHGSNHEKKYPVRKVLSALHAAGVDIFIAGHDHNYERFHPQKFDPHTGRMSVHPVKKNSRLQDSGIVFLVTGGGGAPTYEVEGCKLEGCASISDRLHYLVLDFLGNRLEVSARDMGEYGGKVLSRPLEKDLDHFTLLKTRNPCPSMKPPPPGPKVKNRDSRSTSSQIRVLFIFIFVVVLTAVAVIVWRRMKNR